MKLIIFYSLLTICLVAPSMTKAQDIYGKLSQEFLLSVRYDEDTQSKEDSLANVSPEVLSQELNTEDKKKAFWLNIYNAYVQRILKENADLFEKRSQFFNSKQIKIAGETLSLDMIEHGIIRSSQVKISMGYIGKLFPSKYEKQFRLEKVDPRIHFALNCGAKSCPAVAYYTADRVDDELERAVRGYLKSECEVKDGEVAVPMLFSWFRGDFGGKKGIKEFLIKYDIIDNTDYKISFIEYDWTLQLGQYTDL